MSRLKITANRCLFLGCQAHVVHLVLNCGQIFNVIRCGQLALLKAAHERVNCAHSRARLHMLILCVLTVFLSVQAAAACHWEADKVLAAASATAVTNYPVIPEELVNYAVLTTWRSHTCCCLNRCWLADSDDIPRSDYVGWLVQVVARARGEGGDLSR